ncbi:MAG TPA: hypothetical protein VFD57_06250 [Clostridia bacterium]|nr:hypothetical protein [Clostridia bacterium]
MSWSPDGRTMTVRSQAPLEDEQSVDLWVLPGLVTAVGQRSEEIYDMHVIITK